MKQFIPVILLCSIAFQSFSQQLSENGYVLPPRGTVRVLMVYAQIDFSIGGCPAFPVDGNGNPLTVMSNPDWPDGPSGSSPYWEDDNNPGGNPNAPPGNQYFNNPQPLFDYDWDGTPTPGSLTEYYYEASLGEAIVLGDYISITLPCTLFSTNGGDHYAPIMPFLENMPNIQTAHGKYLDEFDLVDGNVPGLFKSTSPTPGVGVGDDKIDLVVIAFKNNIYGPYYNACAGGAGVNNISFNDYNLSSNGNSYDVDHATSWGGCSRENVFYTFTAEYLHGILGGANWHSGGGQGTYSFMTPPKFYCTTSQYDNPSNVVCTFDRNHLGWKGANKQFLIGAQSAGGQEVNTDLQQPSNAGPFESTYIMRDFVLTGDALRIKLPHIDYEADEKEFNQYLWFENHQMLAASDHQHFEVDQSMPWSPGLMAYIQVGKNRKSSYEFPGTPLVPVDIFNTTLNPNALGSWMMPVSAEGNYDFKYRPDKADYWCGWGNGPGGSPPRIPIEREASLPNAFTGFSDLFNLYNFDNDGQVANDGDDWCDVYRGEVIDDDFVCSMQGYGDPEDAFNIGSGKTKIGLSTNPSAVPIYSLRSHSFYNDPNTPNTPPVGELYDVESFNNRVIHLNGLSITILEQIPSALPPSMHNPSPFDTKVKVKWDDYNIENDVRWCGEIKLYPSVHFDGSPLTSTEYSLNVLSNKSITLDRGKSPTQHIAYEQDPMTNEWLFTKPTFFTATSNSFIHMEPSSNIYIRNGSTLALESDSRLEIHEEAYVNVENGSSLIVRANAVVSLHPDAFIVVKEGGTMIIEDDGIVSLSNDAQIFVEPGGKLIYRNLGVDLTQSLSEGITVGTPGPESGAQVHVEGTLQFEGGASFTFKGSGRYVFAGQDASVVFTDPGSEVNIVGPSQGFPVLTLANAAIDFSDVPVTLQDGAVTLEGTGTIVSHNNDFLQTNFNADGNNYWSDPLFELNNNTSVLVNWCRFDNLTRVYNIEDIPLGVAVGLHNLRYSNITEQAVRVYNAEFVKMSATLFSGAPALIAFHFERVKKADIQGGVVSNADSGFYISKCQGAYFSALEITDMITGISGVDAQIFMRNGATIRRSSKAGVYLKGNPVSHTYTSMLTMGDIGCANIIDFLEYGILGRDCIMNIDAWVHANNNGSSTAVPNSITRWDSHTGKFIKLSYYNWNTLGQVPSQIKATGNYWGIVPSASDFVVNKYPTATNWSPTPLPVNTTPLTTCQVVDNDCVSCVSTGGGGSGGSGTRAPQDEAIKTNFQERYVAFAPLDTTQTREPFVDLSALPLTYDSTTTQWTVTGVDGTDYVVNDTSVLLLMVSKVLKLADDSSGRQDINDIFEKFNATAAALNQTIVRPNPGYHSFTISTSKEWTNLKVQTVMGSLVYETDKPGNATVNTVQWRDGLYAITLYFKDGSFETVNWIKTGE